VKSWVTAPGEEVDPDASPASRRQQLATLGSPVRPGSSPARWDEYMGGVEIQASRRASRLSWCVDAAVAAVLLAAFWAQPLAAATNGWDVAAGAGAAALAAAATVARWKLPGVAPAAALLATGTGWLFQVSTDPMLAVAWCLYPLALRRAVRTRVIGIAAIAVMVLVSLSYGIGSTSAWLDQRVVVATAAIGAAWLLGRVEAQRLEAVRWSVQQQQAYERAVQQAAMAREVHDVVGHALSVISAEADVARNLPGLGEAELRESLADIEQRSRGALEDVQGLVRALREGRTEPAPAPALPRLVAAAQATGLTVRTRLDMPEGPSDEVGLIVSRVVQEALSNVVRHANASRCEVAVWREEHALNVRVDDDGAGLSTDHAPGAGLTGMRERVEGLGGSLTVTNRLQGGTRVLAEVPVGAAS
jgi:signal transduction histidine kinase